MATWRSWSRVRTTAAVAMAALMTGCFVGSSSSTSSGSAGGGPAPGGGSTTAAQPLLAVLDTGQSLTAQGGQGVGVFTEYDAGGHWHVWWTCDTSLTQLACQFRVDVTVSAGAVSNVTSELTAGAAPLTQAGASELTATTNTTTGVDGVRFDTAPGATITLDAQVNGARDGAFLFFVQDGKVNGGFQGTISDPLMLQPSSP
jgi:hypothetical protein